MGNGSVKRYIGGKRPENYFREIVWPETKNIFKNLNISETRGVSIFTAFSSIDIAESGKISMDDFLKYFGGNFSKYIERLLLVCFNDDNISKPEFQFVEFAITVWNFCTFNARFFARYLFEMMDIDNVQILGRPEIETMYRIIYDSDDFDAYQVSILPFDKQNYIKKSDFMEFVRRKKHFVQPAINYQYRLRKKLGGVRMWEELSNFRRRAFMPQDLESPTLDIALLEIMENVKIEKVEAVEDADSLLEKQRLLINKEIEEAKQAMLERDRVKAEILRNATVPVEDLAIEEMWTTLARRRKLFQSTIYTSENAWDRQEAREALYKLFDEAVAATLYRISQLEEKDVKYEEGTQDDVQARITEFLKTSDGEDEISRLKMLEVLRGVKKTMDDNPGKGPAYMTKYRAVEKILNRMETGQRQQIQAQEIADKYASKEDLLAAEKRALVSLGISLTNIAVDKVRQRYQNMRNDKRRAYEAIEKDMKMIDGSRNTRYELIDDNVKGLKYYLNVDTLQMFAEDTAICEQCDNILEQADIKCFVCNAPRNEKNAHLYHRPVSKI